MAPSRYTVEENRKKKKQQREGTAGGAAAPSGNSGLNTQYQAPHRDYTGTVGKPKDTAPRNTGTVGRPKSTRPQGTHSYSSFGLREQRNTPQRTAREDSPAVGQPRRKNTQSQGIYSSALGLTEKKTAAGGSKTQQGGEYSRALAAREKDTYGDLKRNIKTDLSRAGELMAFRRAFTYALRDNPAAAQQPEYMGAVQAISDIRQNLRAEGLDEDTIDALLEKEERDYNQASTEKLRSEATENARERNGFSNAVTETGAGLLGGITGYADLAIQKLGNKLAGADPITGQERTIDYNSPMQSLYHASAATNQGEMEKLVEKYAKRDAEGNIATDEFGNVQMTTEGTIRQNAYGLGVSMGQSAVTTVLTMAGVPAATLLLSGTSAVNTAHEYHEKGYSDGTALFMGFADGALEYFTEKAGMDQLFKTRDVTGISNWVMGTIRNVAAQGAAEGSEELLSTVGHTITDILVNRDRSEFISRYNELLMMGYPEKSAKEIAGKEWVKSAWQDFSMGALSGMIFGGAGTALRGAANTGRATVRGAGILTDGTVGEIQSAIDNLDDNVRQAAAVSDTGVDAQEDAQESATESGAGAGDNYTLRQAYRAGRAAQGLERAQVMQDIQNILQQAGEENISPELLTGLYARSVNQRTTGAEQRAIRRSGVSSKAEAIIEAVTDRGNRGWSSKLAQEFTAIANDYQAGGVRVTADLLTGTYKQELGEKLTRAEARSLQKAERQARKFREHTGAVGENTGADGHAETGSGAEAAQGPRQGAGDEADALAAEQQNAMESETPQAEDRGEGTGAADTDDLDSRIDQAQAEYNQRVAEYNALDENADDSVYRAKLEEIKEVESRLNELRALQTAMEENQPTERQNTQESETPRTEDRGEEGSNIEVSAGPSAINGQSNLAFQLASKIELLQDMQPVAKLTGNELNDKSKKLSEQITEYFDSIGNSVTREGFGEILLNDYGVGGVLNHRPLNRAKVITLAAVPEVLTRGRQIEYTSNWKGRGYDSYVFAAPVNINGSTVYVAAVVDRDAQNRFYLNECVDSNGNYIRIKESLSGIQRAGLTVQDGVTAEPKRLSTDNVPQAAQGVNRENEKNFGDADGDMEENLPEEEPAPAETEISGEEDLEEAADRAVHQLSNGGGIVWRDGDVEYHIRVSQTAGGKFRGSVVMDGKYIFTADYDSGAQAAESAVGYTEDVIHGYRDSAMEHYRSEQTPEPDMMQELMDPDAYKKRVDRRLANEIAKMSQATLREQIRRTDTEIKQLQNMDRRPGQQLTDAQRKNLDFLRRKAALLERENTARKERAQAARAQRAGQAQETGGKGGQPGGTVAQGETGGKPVQNRPTQSVKDLRRDLMDLLSTPTGKRREVGDAIEKIAGKIAERGSVSYEDVEQVMDTLMDAGMVKVEADEVYQNIRARLAGTYIHVSEQTIADFGDDWDSYRRRAMGDKIYLTKERVSRNGYAIPSADQLNQELAEEFGENLFPTGGANSDILDNLLKKANMGRDREIPLQEAMEREARQANTDYDAIYNEYYDTVQRKMETFAEKAGIEVQLKDKSAKLLREERARHEAYRRAEKDKREIRELANETFDAIRRLERKEKRVNPEFKHQIEDLLKPFDTICRRITGKGMEYLQALAEAYLAQAEADGYESPERPGNFIRNEYVEARLSSLGKKQVYDMTPAELRELLRTAQGIENSIRTQNQMLGQERDARVDEMAHQANGDIKATRGAPRGAMQTIHKWLFEEHLDIRRFLEHLAGWKHDGAMEKLALELEDGQTRSLDFQLRSMRVFDDFLADKNNRKWLERESGKNTTWKKYYVTNNVSAEGAAQQEIEINSLMRVALYMHSQNDDNLRHIENGGVRVPDKALFVKGKVREAYASGTVVKMRPQTVRDICLDMTAEEKAFAGVLEQFFDHVSKDAINEVSLQLDGFERAVVQKYFPIYTDANFNKSDVGKEAVAGTVEGIGSIANERIHGGNPVMLQPVTETLLRQIDDVSKYYGMAIPIRDFNAVYNYVFHEKGNAFAGSMKDTIGRKWGAGANDYITKMLGDLQRSSRKGDMLSSLGAKLRGNMAGATLTFNPSVAFSQFASLPGAAQSLGYDAIAYSLHHKVGRDTTKLMEKYTPLYWYRNQGNSTQELGDAVKEKGIEQKLPWAFGWIQKMDSFTIRRLWAAAEYRVRHDNPNLRPGSQEEIDAKTDPYYKEVARVFNRAVYDTQPNYTTMERPQILRSESDLTKFLAMYKTVPLQYYGMMVEAAGKLKAAHRSGDSAQIKNAKKFFARTYSGVLAANMMYVAIKAAFKGIRKKDDDYRDEEGKLTAASVSKQLGRDLVDTYAGSIVLGTEIESIIDAFINGGKFAAPEVSALSFVEDSVNSIGGVLQAAASEDPRKMAGALKDAFQTVLMGAKGWPTKNMETWIQAALQWLNPEAVLAYDNIFGGITKQDLPKMDAKSIGSAARLLLQNRAGIKSSSPAGDELGRLYAAGYTDALPGMIPDSFTYNGKTVEITDRSTYSDAWGAVVGDSLEKLLSLDEYQDADDKYKTTLVKRLFDYATVQARRTADPDYSTAGNSSLSWVNKVSAWVKSGVSLADAICLVSEPTEEGFQITNPAAYQKKWDEVVNRNLSNLTKHPEYRGADDRYKTTLVKRLFDYATVQARRMADPDYSTAGNSSLSWVNKVSAWVKSGVSLADAICLVSEPTEEGFQITNPAAYQKKWDEVVNRNLSNLTKHPEYRGADEKTRQNIVNRLYQYATVRARQSNDPSYTVSDNSTYQWTQKADALVEAGMSLDEAIIAYVTLSGFTADKDANGKSISGSKKAKVVEYIDSLDISDELKNMLYNTVAGYSGSWNGSAASGKKSGGGRRSGKSGRAATPKSAGKVGRPANAGKSRTPTYSDGFDVSDLFGGVKPRNAGTDVTDELIRIINTDYGGDATAALFGVKPKGRTTVDFEL